MLAFALPSQSESLYGEGTRWEITECEYDESEYKHCATFEVLGDTVIDAIIYKKVYKTYLGDSPFLFAVILLSSCLTEPEQRFLGFLY